MTHDPSVAEDGDTSPAKLGRRMKGGSLRIAADIGGTFTDIAAILADGSLITRKLPSTPHDYAEAVVEGVLALLAGHGLAKAELGEVLHGCTVATNAILENKGARTALITTAGFRDVLELRRIRVPRLYEPLYVKPPPLVPRQLRLEVVERMGPRGEIVTPLDETSLAVAIERLKRERIEAVAVCFLHSYANPEHERRVGEALRRALPNAFVTLSIEILPEMREYERTSTTVINAFVGPPVKAYLRSLIRRLGDAGLSERLLMMQSSGGILDARVAMDKPAQIVECGPAAGVIGATHAGALAGYRDLITFDMGGTTAKASLVEDGKLVRTDEYEVGGGISLSSRLVKGGGYALRLPVIDISEVGAGGGSIVWLDKAGSLKVGPHSAGAVPGPACYAAGGTEPTITDANVVLGYLNPHALAGGSVPIESAKSHAVIEAKVARPLGLSVVEAAFGIHQVATTVMMRAVKAVSTYRGRDPRDFALFAFGGNGGVHAGELARGLHMQRIVLPAGAGVFSALGLLFADVELGLSRAFLRPIAGTAPDAMETAFEALEHEVARQLDAPVERVQFRRQVDLRYSLQAFELTVPVPPGRLDAAAVAALAGALDAEHERTYGHRLDAARTGEIVNLRVTGALPTGGCKSLSASATMASFGPPRRRHAYFGRRFGMVETPVLARDAIGPAPLAGPLIIEEYEGTTVVPPDGTVRRDGFDNLVVALPES